jgi:hypothetical protein
MMVTRKRANPNQDRNPGPLKPYDLVRWLASCIKTCEFRFYEGQETADPWFSSWPPEVAILYERQMEVRDQVGNYFLVSVRRIPPHTRGHHQDDSHDDPR